MPDPGAALLLLAVLAAPCWGQAEALARLQEEHAVLTAEGKKGLAEVRNLRESYPAAADKGAALTAWGEALRRTDDFFRRSNETRISHRKMLKTRLGMAFSKAISSVVERTYKPDQGSAKIFADESIAEEMKASDTKFAEDLRFEHESFEFARDALQLQRRKRALLVKGAMGAAVFLLLVVVIIAPWKATPPPQAPPAPALPEALALLAGNFQVGDLIGRGSMGEVFSAVDKTLNRRVALKRMRPELLAEPKDRERFLSEARLVAGLRHPNIVAIHSVAQEGGETYLVFEFVEGRTLEDAVREKGRLPWTEALAHLRGICAALQCAHANAVVHRDLKPSNIMLTGEGAVKVMDFGIAHQARVSASRMTRGTSLGTPPYMAPEQELGGVSASVDLYAAAVCFYEMLTGRPPFTGPNFLAQKREEVYAPASSLAPGLPPGVDAFFKAALSPEPSRRPRSAAALYAAAEAAAR